MSNGKDSIWSEARVSVLKTMFAQGQSAGQIAKFLANAEGIKITRSAVIGKLTRLGLMGNTPLDVKRVRPVNRAVKRAKPAVIAPDKSALPPAPKAPFKPRTIEIGPNAVRLTERERFACAFPVGTETGEGLLVCGSLATRGAYCAAHAQLAYVPVRVSA